MRWWRSLSAAAYALFLSAALQAPVLAQVGRAAGKALRSGSPASLRIQPVAGPHAGANALGPLSPSGLSLPAASPPALSGVARPAASSPRSAAASVPTAAARPGLNSPAVRTRSGSILRSAGSAEGDKRPAGSAAKPDAGRDQPASEADRPALAGLENLSGTPGAEAAEAQRRTYDGEEPFLAKVVEPVLAEGVGQSASRAGLRPSGEAAAESPEADLAAELRQAEIKYLRAQVEYYRLRAELLSASPSPSGSSEPFPYVTAEMALSIGAAFFHLLFITLFQLQAPSVFGAYLSYYAMVIPGGYVLHRLARRLGATTGPGSFLLPAAALAAGIPAAGSLTGWALSAGSAATSLYAGAWVPAALLAGGVIAARLSLRSKEPRHARPQFGIKGLLKLTFAVALAAGLGRMIWADTAYANEVLEQAALRVKSASPIDGIEVQLWPWTQAKKAAAALAMRHGLFTAAWIASTAWLFAPRMPPPQAAAEEVQGRAAKPRKPRARWTYALIAANVAAEAALSASPSLAGVFLLDYGANWEDGFGIYSRPEAAGPLLGMVTMATHAFAHSDTSHLLSNMIGLLVYGRLVEKAAGPPRFLGLYALGILAGAAAGIFLAGSMAGASAAVMAVSGAYLVAYARGLLHPVYVDRPVRASIEKLPGFNAWLTRSARAAGRFLWAAARHTARALRFLGLSALAALVLLSVGADGMGMLGLMDFGAVGHLAHFFGFLTGAALALVWGTSLPVRRKFRSPSEAAGEPSPEPAVTPSAGSTAS